MESTVARWQIQGWNVAFREGYVVFDDRILNAAVIQRLDRCPDRVVLGSSRCLQLRRAHFPGENFLNHGVRRGVLEDLVLLWQLYRRRGWRPQQVILGVDAWLLDANYWKDYWKVLRPVFQEIQTAWNLPQSPENRGPTPGGGIPGNNRWKRLLAAATAPTGIFFFRTQQDERTELVRRDDGSVCYHAAFRDRTAEQVADTIRRSVRFPAHTISPLMTALLEAFVARLRADGVAVSFMIPPYHPAFFQLGGTNAVGDSIAGYEQYLAGLTAVETLVRNLAEKHTARVVGGFSPAKLRVGEAEFFDWMHPKPAVFERLLRATV